MCGRLNVIDNPALIELCEGLGIQIWPSQQQFGRFKRATEQVSIVRSKASVRRMDNAVWWLLLEPSETGFKPSKYTSFNTRYDKLNTPRSAGYQAYRHSRCVIPVMGFGESEFKNKKPLHYHDFTAVDGAFLLAGLCREWVNKSTGESALSCSVITVPPHPKLTPYHSKSSPMMLAPQSDALNLWLDEQIQDTELLGQFVKAFIPIDLKVQQIDKPSKYNSIGEPVIIPADD